jgi:hypothetical protein
VNLISRIADWLSARATPSPAAPTRRERRAAARQRHREAGGPLWTKDDLQEGPAGTHWVADVTPGTPGHYGSARTVEDE